MELRLGIEPSHYEPGAVRKEERAPEEEPTEEREAVKL